MSSLPRSRVEFHSKTLADANKRSGIAFVDGPTLVPPVGAIINIRKQDWKVVEVFYAVDHPDNPLEVCVRACVFMETV